MSDSLTLPCVAGSLSYKDTLQVERTSGVNATVGGPDVISIVATEGDAAAAIWLDAASARELFNWLGVQLHKGNLKDG